MRHRRKELDADADMRALMEKGWELTIMPKG